MRLSVLNSELRRLQRDVAALRARVERAERTFGLRPHGLRLIQGGKR